MNVFKKIEAGANFATIALVALFGWTVFHGNSVQRTAQTQTRQPSAPKVGQTLKQGPLKDVNWSANKNTLVMGLQTTCHFCSDSSPFFQKLPAAASGATKIVAVLPQSVDESKQYLAKLGVQVDEIRSAPLSSIGVSGTPTLVLVDDKGIVKKVWVGKLSEEGQSEVLSAISAKSDTHIKAMLKLAGSRG